MFGTIKPDKPNTGPDKYIYSGYRTGFDHTGTFTHPDGGIARNIITFEVDTSSSVHATNKTQNILVFGKAFIQKINNITIYAGKIYSPNSSVENKIFVLSLYYNGDNSYLFVNGQKVTQFRAKKLGTFNFSAKNVNDIKMYGNVYYFPVDYSTISNKNILKIHKYLMKKNGVV